MLTALHNRRNNHRENPRKYGRPAVEESIEIIIIEVIAMIEIGIGLDNGHFTETMTIIENEVQAIVDQVWDLELIQKGIEKGVISVGNMIIL